MALGLIVMYVVMFSMIDRGHDFRNNLNMFYMAVTMWAPMGIFMLAAMPGMFPRKQLNIALYVGFIVLTVASYVATRAQALIDDRQFISSMIPHHSGAILMCREAEKPLSASAPQASLRSPRRACPDSAHPLARFSTAGGCHPCLRLSTRHRGSRP